MEGMGYVLSWDLIEWISTNDLPRSDHNGNADTNCFRHDFIPDSILVHRLKLDFEWVNTLKYFNVTSGLKSSKFYNIV
jgi:hypothetical protein